jgi:hypothetical protein
LESIAGRAAARDGDRVLMVLENGDRLFLSIANDFTSWIDNRVPPKLSRPLVAPPGDPLGSA